MIGKALYTTLSFLVILFLIAPRADAQAMNLPLPATPADWKPSNELKTAWQSAGATVGWYGLTDGGVIFDFDQDRSALNDAVLCMKFKEFPSKGFDELPDPGTPFVLIAEIDSLTDADLKDLSHLPSLVKLSAKHVRAVGRFATLLEKSSLKSLDLRMSQLNGRGLAAISKIAPLQQLFLYDTFLRDDDLKPLVDLHNLKALQLPKSISDRGLNAIGQITSLEDLSLSGCNVTNEGVNQLQGLRNLKRLSLGRTKIDHDALKIISGFHALEQLDFQSTKMAGPLDELRDIKGLQNLLLSGTAINDTDLKVLAEMKSLKRVYLTSSKVTDAGVAALQNALPDCDISFVH